MAGCLCLFCLWPQVLGVFGGFGSQGCVLCAFADKMLLVGFLSCGTAIFSLAICCNFNCDFTEVLYLDSRLLQMLKAPVCIICPYIR